MNKKVERPGDAVLFYRFYSRINSIISKIEREDACYRDAHPSKNISYYEVPCLVLKGSFMPEKNKSVLKEIHILGREKESRRR